MVSVSVSGHKNPQQKHIIAGVPPKLATIFIPFYSSFLSTFNAFCWSKPIFPCLVIFFRFIFYKPSPKKMGEPTLRNNFVVSLVVMCTWLLDWAIRQNPQDMREGWNINFERWIYSLNILYHLFSFARYLSLLIVGGNLAAKWPSLLFPQGPFFIHLIKTIQTISTCVFHIILIFW